MNDAVPQPLQLAGQIAALTAGIAIAVRHLAKHNGGTPGPWLDELEAEMVSNVKATTFSDGLPMEFEISFQNSQLEVLKAAFQFARRRLAEQQGD